MNQRVVEIGIGMALGATGSNIRWMVLRRGLINTLIGLFLGAILSWGLSQILMATFMNFEIEYYSYAAAVLVLVIVSIVANSFPARKASRMDPMSALRVQ